MKLWHDLCYILYESIKLTVMDNYNTIEVHISTIKNGDTIEHIDGHVRTVCNNNIKRGFTGITLFGDSYNMGTKPVKKVIFK